MTQNSFIRFLLAVSLTLATAGVSAESVPSAQRDPSKVFFGDPASFSAAAEVDLDAVMKETEEYQEITKKRVEPGTGKYWILIRQAKSRALKAVATVAESSDYDLIAAAGYLGGLEPPVSARDITGEVIAALDEG